MGCCLSRTSDGGQPHSSDEDYSPAKARSPESFTTHVGNISSDGAPVLVEEETVKEVLSETPIAKPCSLQLAAVQNNKIKEPEFIKGLVSKTEECVLSETSHSQITDFCSNMSESISMATTISEQIEDEVSSKRSREIGRSTELKIRRKRPYAGDPFSRREQREKCPSKSSELLPEKNSPATRRYAQGTASTMTRKLNLGPDQQSGVHYGRRSRSPASRTARGTSKMGSVKKSAMKVTGKPGEQQKITVAEEGDVGKKTEEPLDGVVQPANESAENPVVSLECFIFL